MSKELIEKLQQAESYAHEQSENVELKELNRGLYRDDQAYLKIILQLVHTHFGTPDREHHWFWRGDYE